MLETAQKLLLAGYWVIAIYPRGVKVGERTMTGKEPIGRAWGMDRWTPERLRQELFRWPGAGLGILFGPGRAPGGGWLAEVEGDGPRADESLSILLGGECIELETVSWSSTRGFHWVFLVDGERLLKLLMAAGAKEKKDAPGVWHVEALPDLEFRIGGYKPDGTAKQIQSVIPPTPGTDGTPRAWIGPPSVGVAKLPEAAYAFLERLVAEQRPPPVAVAQPLPARRPRIRPSGEDWHHAFLRRALDQFAGASEGGRHAALLKWSPPLAGRVKGGFLGEREVLDGLHGAARQNGMLAMGRSGEIDEAWRSAMEMAEPYQDSRHRPLRVVGGNGERRGEDEGGPPADDGGPPEADAVAADGDDRPAIEISTDRHLAEQETLKALTRDPDLFCRGDSLGVVAYEEEDVARLPGGVEMRHVRGGMRFVPSTQAVLGCRLTRNATFFVWVKDKHGELIAKDCHPPNWLIAAVAEQKFWPGMRQLMSIAECPYVFSDGSIPEPGFDARTGTLYHPAVAPGAIPEHPTQEDARQAVARFRKLLEKFPFEGDADFDVWLAALLTVVQRPAIAGPVPGMAFNGNKAGVGKGLLINLIGNICWGHDVGTRSYPSDPVEADKVKLSLALAAVPMVHFDNLGEGGGYGGSVIDSCLTSTYVEGRILGATRESGMVPLRPSWFVSGNNIAPVKDANRRWLSSNLVTHLDRPHERDDLGETSLHEHVVQTRGILQADALIILKAHAMAGRPAHPWPVLGSYEDWDPIVRGAVWYATGRDCLTTQHRGADEAPDQMDKSLLLVGWQEADLGGRGLTVQEALEKAAAEPERFENLRLGLLSMSKDGKMPDVNRIRYKLRSLKNTPIRGLRFESCDPAARQQRWRVVGCAVGAAVS